jgi:hypothetical protein
MFSQYNKLSELHEQLEEQRQIEQELARQLQEEMLDNTYTEVVAPFEA